MPKSKPMTECPVCHGRMTKRAIRYSQEWKGEFVVFENVPADVCETCGEQLLEEGVVGKINETLWSMKPPHRHLQVPLYDLAVT